MPVSDKKRAYGARMQEYVENYKSAFIVHCDNVGSKQMQQIRITLRGKAVVLMGKNVSVSAWAGGIVWGAAPREGSLRCWLPPRRAPHPSPRAAPNAPGSRHPHAPPRRPPCVR